MACSGTNKGGGLVTFEVKVNGNTIDGDINIFSIEIEKLVNKISSAVIVIKDGDAATGKFEASSSDTFVPGAEIDILAGYENKNITIFQGIITEQNIQVNKEVGSALSLKCRDKAIKMVVGRKSKTYAKKKDSDIISSIINAAGGLSANVTATETQWEEQVQYYTTDWDFVMARAESNGMIVTTENGKVSVIKPDNDTSSVLDIQYGDNLIEFEGALDAITQLAKAKANSWDFKTQKTINGEASNSYAGAGNLSSKKLSEVVGLSDYELQTSGYLQQSDLVNWSKSAMIKSEYSKTQGNVKVYGTSKVNPANYISLKALGDRINGDHIVSGVTHEIKEGSWTTDISFGLSPVWFTEEPDVMSPPAAGLLPGVRGLFNATVKKMYEDPDNQYRIQIDLPLFDPNGEGLWARLSNFYSTSDAGAFFLPEVGDEVVVGFLNEDPRYPIILGSLYSSSKLKPYSDYSPAENNPKKAIVSKSGIVMEFDDKDKVFSVTTPSKNTVTLSDKDKEISVKDQNGNSIVMSSSGIEIKSDKNISVEAGQNLTLKGNMGVTVEASSGDVQVKGLNIKENAQIQYSAEGSASAQVQGGANLTLKGAMVMIN